MLGLAVLLLLTAKTSILQRHENAVNLSTYLPTLPLCVAMVSRFPQQRAIKVRKVRKQCVFFFFLDRPIFFDRPLDDFHDSLHITP